MVSNRTPPPPPSHTLSVIFTVLANSTAFSGGKRGREDEEAEEGIGNYHRKRHNWLYNVVSGTGGWGQGQHAKSVSLEKGKGGGAGKGSGAFPFRKKSGNN
jgi:hypothetical protein